MGASFGPNEIILPTATSDPSGSTGSMYLNTSDGNVRIKTAQGWETSNASGDAPYDAVPSYSATDYNILSWDTTEHAMKMVDTSDTTIAASFPAFRVDTASEFKLTIHYKGSAAETAGLYIRIHEYDSEMPVGKTHIAVNASTSASVVQEATRALLVWEGNSAIPTDWTTSTYTYSPTSTAKYASIVVMRWSDAAASTALYFKRPLIQVSGSDGIITTPYDVAPAYGSADYDIISWDATEHALKVSDSSDDSIGVAYPAFRVDTADEYKLTVHYKGSAVESQGLYIRVMEYDSELPVGKTHISNVASASAAVVQEDTRQITTWKENEGIPTSWTTSTFTYSPTSTAKFASVAVLRWTAAAATTALYLKDLLVQPSVPSGGGGGGGGSTISSSISYTAYGTQVSTTTIGGGAQYNAVISEALHNALGGAVPTPASSILVDIEGLLTFVNGGNDGISTTRYKFRKAYRTFS